MTIPYAMPRKGKEVTEQEFSLVSWLYDRPALFYTALIASLLTPIAIGYGISWLFGFSRGWTIGFCCIGGVVGGMIAVLILWAGTMFDIAREDLESRGYRQ